MTNIKTVIENSLYQYDQNEFMPVYVDGQLANKPEFVAYKAGRAAEHIGHALVSTTRIMGAVGSAVLEHVTHPDEQDF
jgi:hypothetical protein